MFDTLLINTLFLLASLLVCLLNLRLSINIKHICLIYASFIHSLPILTDYLKFRPPPPFILTPRLLNLTKISDPPVYFDLPFIRHLRVKFFKKTRRGLEVVSLPHFLYDFSRKIFLLLYSIN